MLNSARVVRLYVLALTILALVLTVGGAAFFAPAPARAQESLEYEQYRVDIFLNEDGAFTVSSTQSVRFDGEYNTAFAEIPIDRAASIRGIRVFEQDPAGGALTPLKFSVSPGETAQFVDWEYSGTQAGDLRTFVVEYTVAGGLWVYGDNDQLRWFAVNGERSGLPVRQAEVTVHLPPSLVGEPVSAQVLSGNGTVREVGNTVLLRADGPLPNGEPFEIALSFPHGIIPAQVQPWQRAVDEEELQVSLPSVDVTVEIRADGTLGITEELAVRVDQGVLYTGFRALNLLYMDGVSNVRVAQDGVALDQGADGCTRCYVVQETPAFGAWAYYDPETAEVAVDEEKVGRIDVDWVVEGVERGRTTVFTVAYDVEGAIRASQENQLLNLDILPDYDLPIDQATLRILPPPGVATADILVESSLATGAPQPQPGGALLLEAQELPASRARWEVVITLPAGATAAQPPRWQAQFEQAVAQSDVAQVEAARRSLTYRTGGILATVLAILGAIWGWFRYGRKRTREMLNGYVADPPSDLAPGVVAYLMDREASERGVLASLFHLASAGLLDIDLSSGVQLRRTGDESADTTRTFKARDGNPVRLEDHQVYLYNGIIRPNTPVGQFVALDTLSGPLRSQLPDLFAQMGNDAQDFFLSPAGGATNSRLGGCFGPSALFVTLPLGAALLLGAGLDKTTTTILAVAGFSIVAALLFVGLMRPMGRRRSPTGEAEAKRWGMFRTYLLNIKEYGDQGAAQEILDRHFAYAVALGAENVVLAQAEELGAGLPQWMPVPTHYPTDYPSSSGPTGPNWPRPDLSPRPVTPGTPAGTTVTTQSQARPRPRPTLSGLSRTMGEALASGSRSLGSVLSTAAGDANRSVVLKSQVRERTLEWPQGTPPSKMLDDVMRQSLNDARTIRSRPATGASSPGWGGQGVGGSRGGSTWGGGSSGSSRGSGGSSWSRGSSRSSGGFGGSSRSSGSSSSRSSSSSSRSSSGGRSGFGRK